MSTAPQAPLAAPAPDAARTSRRAHRIALVLVVLALALLRVRVLDVPLERDEGEYAYAGQLLLAGNAPFDGAYNMKLPGIYAVYALVMAAFGQTDVGIHLGLLVASTLSTLLLFRLVERLFDATHALIAAALFALLSLSATVQGMFANSEHFVLPFVLSGLLLLLRAFDVEGEARVARARRLVRLFAGGCLLGAAVLVKQHALFFVLLGAGMTAFCARGPTWRGAASALASYSAGVALPYAVTVLVCLSAGTFGDFWRWTFVFARDYVGLTSWERGLDNLATNGGAIVSMASRATALAVVGLVALAFARAPRRHRWIAAGFVVASAAAVCPGLYFRPHYFVLLLPAAAMLAALGAVALGRLLGARRALGGALAGAILAGLLALAALGEIAAKQRAFLFTLAPEQISRRLYGPSPFPEARVIGDWIREHTAPDARIAALCSEPQFYFYARRRASTGFLYLYALMEKSELAQRMQRDLIAEFEAHPPELVITTPSRDSFADYPGTWQELRAAHPDFFAWYDKTLAESEQVGVADVPARGQTAYRFGDEARDYRTRSPFAVFVRRPR